MPPQRRCDLAGHVLSLGADIDGDRALLGRFFGALPVADRRADLVVRVTPDTVDPRLATDHPPAMRQGPTRRWMEESTLIVLHDLGALAHVTDATLHIDCPPAVRERWRAIRHLLYSGLSWWFERRGLLMLHAAMIARRDDAVLILGATGNGKSTAAYAAVNAGWNLCSDDLVLVGCGDGRVRAIGIPKSPTIEGSLASRADDVFGSHPEDDRGRIILDGGAMDTEWKSLRQTIIVGHHVADGTLAQLGHADAMNAVLDASLEVGRPGLLANRLGVFAMLADLPCSELLHAADSVVRLQRAGDLLELAWSRSSEA